MSLYYECCITANYDESIKKKTLLNVLKALGFTHESGYYNMYGTMALGTGNLCDGQDEGEFAAKIHKEFLKELGVEKHPLTVSLTYLGDLPCETFEFDQEE